MNNDDHGHDYFKTIPDVELQEATEGEDNFNYWWDVIAANDYAMFKTMSCSPLITIIPFKGTGNKP